MRVRTITHNTADGQHYKVSTRLLDGLRLRPPHVFRRDGRSARYAGRSQFGQVTPTRCALTLSAEAVFDIATLAVMPFYGLMVAAPKNPATKRLMTSRLPVFLAGVFYIALLVLWSPLGRLWSIMAASCVSSALPSVLVFAQVFSQPEATALAWVHLVTLDLFQAR
jgi:hypothetical protein